MILNCWETKIDCIHEEINDRNNESSDGDSDTVLGVRNRKIRIVDSESDSDIPQDFNNAEWIPCEILSRIKFVTREKPAGVTDILKYWITVGFFKNISY